MPEQNPAAAELTKAFDKDIYDACMKQADYFAGRWDARREFEWKLSLGLWTLLAGGAVFLAGRHDVPWCLFWIPSAVHAVWLRGLCAANRFEKEMGKDFRDQAHNVLAGGKFCNPPIRKMLTASEKWHLCRKDWAMQFQFSCTLLLSIALVALNHMQMPLVPSAR